MKNRFIIFILLIVFAGMSLSCQGSIFSWLYPGSDADSVNSDDIEDYIEAGDAQLQAGHPEKALPIFESAIAKWPVSAIARQRAGRAYLLSQGNVDLLMLASQLSSGGSGLAGSVAASLVPTVTKLINYIGAISLGQCDSSIASTDFEVNLNLMLAYFIRGFLGNGDSNGDTVYFSKAGPNNGDILIFENNSLTYNTNKVNVDNLQGGMDAGVADLSTVLGSGSGTITRSSVSNLLFKAHDVIEDLLLVYKVFSTSFNDFNNAATCFERGITGLSGGQTVQDIKAEITKQVNNMQSYLNGAAGDAQNLSHDHSNLVGTQAFAGLYTSFVESVWTSHIGGVPSGANGNDGFLNRYKDHNVHGGNYNIPADIVYIQRVIDTLLVIKTHVENANLVKNLLGGV